MKDIKYAVRAQRAMRDMLVGLLPCTVVGIYLFGRRALAIVLYCCIVAYVVEMVFGTYRGLGQQ